MGLGWRGRWLRGTLRGRFGSQAAGKKYAAATLPPTAKIIEVGQFAASAKNDSSLSRWMYAEYARPGCVRSCVRACVRSCVRACVRGSVRVYVQRCARSDVWSGVRAGVRIYVRSCGPHCRPHGRPHCRPQRGPHCRRHSWPHCLRSCVQSCVQRCVRQWLLSSNYSLSPMNFRFRTSLV